MHFVCFLVTYLYSYLIYSFSLFLLSSSSSSSSLSSSSIIKVDVVCGNTNWLKFCQLFQKVDEDDNSYFEMALSNSSQYTLFVPTDESFNVVNMTLKEITAAELLRMELFHVYEGEMLTYDDLDCGETILMMSNDTSRTKCDKMVNDTSMNETVKYQTGNGNTKTNTLPKITESNGYACNAIIHERKLYASSLSFSLLLSLSFSLSLIDTLTHPIFDECLFSFSFLPIFLSFPSLQYNTVQYYSRPCDVSGEFKRIFSYSR